MPVNENGLKTVDAQPWFTVSPHSHVLKGAILDADGNLLFCDVSERKVIRLTPDKKLSTVVEIPELAPGGVALHKDGRIFMAAISPEMDKGAIFAFSPASDKLENNEANTPLSGEELSAIDRVRAIIKNKDEIPCTECNHCSCPHGIFISCCFSMYNTTKEFNINTISEHNYGLVLKNTPQEAARCDGCGLCSWQCPQGIDIPTQLRKVARTFQNIKVGW